VAKGDAVVNQEGEANREVLSGNIHAVILAGGQGTRFWPMSRKARPKPFLPFGDGRESLIQATARRALELVGDNSRLWIVTNEVQRALAEEHVPGAQIIAESLPRNTAAAIGLAVAHIRAVDPTAVMVVLPADHAIEREDLLLTALQEAASLAMAEPLIVTVGVPPTSAHTGYGYIRRGASLRGAAYMVHRFYEKPNQERAEQYVSSGLYCWNSGMFISSVETAWNAFEEHMPELFTALGKITEALDSPTYEEAVKAEFEPLESISIDFGVLELARNCAMVWSEPFGWNDIGSWDAWADHFEHDARDNLFRGDVVAIESEGCTVHSEHRLCALVEVSNIVVVDSGDALLICSRDRVQDVKLVVEELRKRGRNDLL